MENEIKGRAKGGVARAKSLSKERMKEISMNAAEAKRIKGELPKAEYEGKLKIGDAELDVAVLGTKQRIITLTDAFKAFDRPVRGNPRLINIPVFMDAKNLQPFVGNDLMEVISKVQYVNMSGRVQEGYDVLIIPLVSDLYLKARAENKLVPSQEGTARKAELLIRSLAKVGIVALVDEVTGFQRDRAKDDLAKILEAFVAKELQPYIRTFDPEYYEYMFKLRGLKYPPDLDGSRPQNRPQYFGKLTNDIVYRRLAPGVLSALKEEAKKAEKKGKLFQHLTSGYGHIKLIKHLSGIIWLMRESTDWQDFMSRLNRQAPRYGDTMPLDLDEPDR